MQPRELTNEQIVKYLSYYVITNNEMPGSFSGKDFYDEVVRRLLERDDMISFSGLKDPKVVHANILRGTIAYTKLLALHYLGVTAIDGWRELISWDDQTNDFDMRDMIKKPVVDYVATGAPDQRHSWVTRINKYVVGVHQDRESAENHAMRLERFILNPKTTDKKVD